MQHKDMFDSLVKNAIDFLQHAILEIQENPKYSVIHFYAAVEILLKARLMVEHWSLVVEEPQQANLNKFLGGDFRSVTIEESIRRLKNIAGVNVPTSAHRSFEQLKGHRNKLVHFFHPEYVEKPSNEVVSGVVAQQCAAWFHLHRLIVKNWRTQFQDHIERIEELNQSMFRLREFLQVRFEALLPSIQKGKERGIRFFHCLSCGFEASRLVQEVGPLQVTQCLVCKNDYRRMLTPCPTCGTAIEVLELGEGKCQECNTDIRMDYLIDTYGAHLRPKDYAAGEQVHAYCPNCEWTEEPSVVPIEEQWICLNCLTVYDEVDYCEWCGELNAGIIEDSFLFGCVLCGGRINWDDD
jgi:hypothetical protein